MSSLNKVQLIGRLGNDVDIRYTPGGTAVAKFNLATADNYKDKDGVKKERTEWHKVVTYGKLAEIVGEYLHKGSHIFVEGKIQTRSWEDPEGNKKHVTEINMKELIMLGGGGKKQTAGGESNPAPVGNNDDDIPSFDASEDVPF